MSRDPQYYILSNGIRLVHMPSTSPVAHMGVFINAGTRDEPEGKEGLAHFIEHMIFKGTRRRKAYHILNRMESVGGELNAFTTKEYTAIYSSFLNKYYDRATELLSDIIFHSAFPGKEMEKEKEVIVEEINSYLDTPSEQIYDDFEGSLFEGHPMGRLILGKPENVRSFSQNDISSFYADHYGPDRMVICSVGKMDFVQLLNYVNKYFMLGGTTNGEIPRFGPGSYKPFNKQTERKTYQSHSIIGNRAYARGDDHRFAFGLLNNILGGPGLNSRLNMQVREKYAYAYQVDSFYFPYSDTGVWGIYLGTDNGSTGKALRLVMKELEKLRNRSLGSLQLSQAKKQYRGQIAIAFDSNVNLMLSGGRSFLFDQKLLSLKTISDRIERVSASELLEIANQIFNPGDISTLTYRSTWNS